jgi:uracil-DNA glycosylase family 4
MTSRASDRLAYLDAMGIQAWSLRALSTVGTRPEAPPGTRPAMPSDVPPVRVPGETAGLDWGELKARVNGCTACELHGTRTQAVFGVGNRTAQWLVIGEAPGKDEDLQGEPFVGRAGQLLDAMLQAIGLERQQVYIANILKCRPPNNRDPKPEEVMCCEPYLMRQIALVGPAIILAVGRIAAQNLLQTDAPIGRLRGRVHRFRDTGIPLVATYHPAYLLRSPVEKRKAWQDLQLAVATLREHAP